MRFFQSNGPVLHEIQDKISQIKSLMKLYDGWNAKLSKEICFCYTLNSLSLFWLAENVRWILEISACDMSRTLKVTRNHDRYAWRVFVASLCVLYCLPTVEKQKHEFHVNFRLMYNKTIVRFGFCDIQKNQGLDKDYQPQPSAENPYLDLIILDNTSFSSSNSFFEHTKCDFFLVNSHWLTKTQKIEFLSCYLLALCPI